MLAKMYQVIALAILLTTVLAAMACATSEDTDTRVAATVEAELTRVVEEATPDVQAMVAAELTRVAPELTATPEPTATPTIADLVSRLRPSLAQIITPDGAGSGFVYDESGLVVTNAHVVDDRDRVTVVVMGEEYRGKVINRNETADLAVVHLDSDDAFEAVSLGSAGRVPIGEEVTALGFPLSSVLGDDFTVTTGVVSARRQFEGYEYFQTDATLNPGNSGGPLLNRDGDVIGIITFGIAKAEGVAFALSVDELNSRLAALSRIPPTATPRPTPIRVGQRQPRGPTATPRPTPTPTPRPDAFRQISADWHHTCGIKSEGRIVCWGIDEGFMRNAMPAGTFRQVDIGNRFVCGVQTDGRVVCSGRDSDGQATPPAGKFQQVSAGSLHACGVKTDGRIACWGSNTRFRDDYAGQASPPAGNFRQVSTGWFHTCGVKTDGRVACWGWNKLGQATPPAGDFQQVSAGEFHTCGVKASGQVICWGSDGYGQSAPPSGQFHQVSASGVQTCGIRTNGTLACWGDNDEGQASPPAGTFQQVSAGWNHTCGLKTDGRVICWGSDEYGQATPP